MVGGNKKTQITEFGQRVRSALAHAELNQTQAARELSKRVGREVKPQTIQHMATKADTSELTADLAAVCGVRYEWLAHNQGDMIDSNAVASNVDPNSRVAVQAFGRTRRLPMVGTAQLGADGYWMELEYPVGHGDGYVDAPTDDPNAYCIRVRGDSMFPAIRSSMFVVVEPNAPLVEGEYVLVKTMDGRSMVKELLWHRNGELALASVNQNFGRLTLKLDEVAFAHYCWPVPASKWRPG